MTQSSMNSEATTVNTTLQPMYEQMSAIQSQLSAVETIVNNLNTTIMALNDTITTLTAQLMSISSAINIIVNNTQQSAIEQGITMQCGFGGIPLCYAVDNIFVMINTNKNYTLTILDQQCATLGLETVCYDTLNDSLDFLANVVGAQPFITYVQQFYDPVTGECCAASYKNILPPLCEQCDLSLGYSFNGSAFSLIHTDDDMNLGCTTKITNPNLQNFFPRTPGMKKMHANNPTRKRISSI